MDDKTALVTGGASGIGKATVHRLASEGYCVIVVDRNESLLQETADELSGLTGKVLHEVLDISDREQVVAFFEKWPSVYGRLDVLVNNAAAVGPKPLVQIEPDLWDRIINVNLSSVYMICKEAYPLLSLTAGAVVNVSSTMGVYVNPGNAAYSISKAGLNHLTKVLAKEWLPVRIRVNAVCPAAVDTPLLHPNHDEEEVDFVERIKLGKQSGVVQTPDQIAAFIALLLRPEASIVTGACIMADGGSQLNG